MDYAQLKKAKPGGYNAAADGFRRMAERIRDHAVDFNRLAREKLAGDDYWDGKFAAAAAQPAGDIQLALNKAADKLEALPDLLTGHASELARHKEELERIEIAAQMSGAKISEDGTVTLSPEAQEFHEKQGNKDIAKQIAEDIERVLKAATEADAKVARELEKALEKIELDAKEVGDEWRDKRDGARAAELAKDLGGPGGADDENMEELQKLLREHKGDDAFATEMFKNLGGGDTAESFADIAAWGEDHPQVQKLMGESLATATDERNPNHLDTKGRWMDDFLAGAKKSYSHWTGGTVTGYEGIGAALNAGDYSGSTEFLNRLGDDMVQYEAKHPDAFKTQGLDDFNHFGEDNGQDPVNGLMKAMGDNETASTQFFNPEHKMPDADGKPGEKSVLTHMLDRDGGTDIGQALVLDAVGTASGGQETGTGLNIAKETVEHLGAKGHPDLQNDAARESMGRVMQGQLGNVNQALGAGGGGAFDEAATSRVLGDVAHSPEAYRQFENAETIYTAAKMDEIAADPSMEDRRGEIASAGRHMASTMAHLDDGQRQAIQEGVNNYKERLDSVGKVSSFAADKLLESAPGGGLAKDVLSGVSGAAMDGMVKDAQDQHFSEQEIKAQEMYDKNRGAAAALAEQTLWQFDLHGSEKDIPDSIPRDESLEPGDPQRSVPLTHMSPEQMTDWLNWKETGYGRTDELLKGIELAYTGTNPEQIQNPLTR